MCSRYFVVVVVVPQTRQILLGGYVGGCACRLGVFVFRLFLEVQVEARSFPSMQRIRLPTVWWYGVVWYGADVVVEPRRGKRECRAQGATPVICVLCGMND